MIRHLASRQFTTFILVGVVAATLHWCARLALSKWLPFPIAVSISYAVGMALAFWLNRRFVFRDSSRPLRKQLWIFLLTNLVFFPVVWITAVGANALLLRAGMRAYSEEVSHAFAISLPMACTFLIYKFIAFKGK